MCSCTAWHICFEIVNRRQSPFLGFGLAALADPANHIVTLEGSGDWTTREVTAPIPDDASTVAFGLFLAGPGRIELRAPELTPGWAGFISSRGKRVADHEAAAHIK
jgi:hypothetical protein